MSRILITGGTGFIGYHTALAHLQKGDEVTLLDNLTQGKKDTDVTVLLTHRGVRLIEADITKGDLASLVGSGYDVVYHLAGINGFKQFTEIPHDVLRVGIGSSIAVLDWFRNENKNQNSKIIFASSNEVYEGALEAFGSLPEQVPEKVPLVIPDTSNPRFSYAGSKIAGELFFIHYAKAYNFRMSIVRLHNIYGPRAGYHPMIPKMIARVAAHTDPFPLIGGEEKRAFCFVEDAVAAMMALNSSRDTDGGTYNVGGEEMTTIAELTQTLFEISGWKPATIDQKPSPSSTTSYHTPNLNSIKKDTLWRPAISLKEGLTKTVKWYKEHPQT